jgi:hypothetical protein
MSSCKIGFNKFWNLRLKADHAGQKRPFSDDDGFGVREFEILDCQSPGVKGRRRQTAETSLECAHMQIRG